MSFISEQKIKGTTYRYEVTAVWNKEKKRSEQKRKYLGKIEPETGEFIPTKKNNNNKPISSKNYGNYYLLDNIITDIGLKKIIKTVFPKNYQEILTCAFYQVCTGDALSGAEQWTGTTNTYTNKILTSQRISDLLPKITLDDRMMFFRKWAYYRTEQEYIACDITSISSYSKLIDIVEQGYNRDKEDLPQINLGAFFGETSRLPIFYNVYPGSIKDVSTIDNLLKMAEEVGIEKSKLVMDKGFFSKSNIDSFLNKYFKFIVGVPFSTKLATDTLEKVRDTINTPSNAILINNDIVYGYTIKDKWENTDRNIYIHTFYDKKRYINEEDELLKKILILEEEIQTETRKESNEKLYERYFTIKKVNQFVTTIVRKEDVINEELKRKGFFIAISNDISDAKEVIKIYRLKDVVEKLFDNMKDELDLDRLRIHSNAALQGKVFITFIASIILAAIHKVMSDKNLYAKYTKKELLTEMSKINIIKFSNGSEMLTEISKAQMDILEAFGIKAPYIKT